MTDLEFYSTKLALEMLQELSEEVTFMTKSFEQVANDLMQILTLKYKGKKVLAYTEIYKNHVMKIISVKYNALCIPYYSISIGNGNFIYRFREEVKFLE